MNESTLRARRKINIEIVLLLNKHVKLINTEQ